MRFNFITIYSDTVTPVCASNPSFKHEVITLRGSLEPIYSQNLPAFFGPIFSSFDSTDFALFSKIFVLRNSYLSEYTSKKSDHFGAYSNLSLYSPTVGSAFEKNVLLYKTVKNFKYNSLIFRANGFRFGSFAFNKLSPIKAKFFRFFRNFGFFKMFVRLTMPIFMNRAKANGFFINFFSFLKSSFFTFFPNFSKIGRSKKVFRRFNRHKIKFLKQAFLFFFFFQNQFIGGCVSSSKIGFRVTSPSSFYLSEAIFFSSRFGFQKKANRRFLTLAAYLS